MRRSPLVCALVFAMPLYVYAQQPVPAAALAARTVAVENDTHDSGVEAGAEAALRDWGLLRVVDDPETADVTLRFDKKSDHDGESNSGTDAEGHQNYSYSMTFGSKIQMHAYMKGSDFAFYSTTTDDGKRKAGVTCVNALRTAYREARTH